MTTQDFEKGIDITGLNPVNAGDLNNLVDLSAPTVGHGLLLINKDAVLDTPYEVPNATLTVKWKRYIWLRLPHATAVSQTPKIYGWNDNVVSDPVMLKWVEITVDIAAITALITLSDNKATAAVNTANSALVAANNATTSADNALAAIVDANTKADTAIADSTTAQENAATAVETANTAKTAADAAAVLVAAKRDVGAALNPGTANQTLRTSSDATVVEWFSPVNLRAKFSETQNKGTHAGASSAGLNKRVLNTEDYDTGNLASNAGGDITIAAAGVYHFKGLATARENGGHQLFLCKNDDSVLLSGISRYDPDGGENDIAIVEGILVVAAGDVVRLNHYIEKAVATNGLGTASDIAPAGGKEVYAELHITKLY